MDNDVLKQKLFEAVKQKGLIVEQANGGKKDFIEMMSLLLHSQTQVHAYHLQTKSYAEHKALQNYYEDIDGLVDGLVESYQGKYSILKGYKQYPIEDYKDTTTTINYLKDLCEKVTELRDCCKDTWIQNQIDNVCELINSTLYKMRFLK
jgi:hypothetical protein